MKYLMYETDARWEPHPAGIPGVEVKKLRSRESGDYQESIAFVRVPAGSVVPVHVHPKEDDNLFILEGFARMRVGGEEFSIGPGAQITVPAAVEHEIFAVSEELRIYNVFSPKTF